jgi:hypothetical protein
MALTPTLTATPTTPPTYNVGMAETFSWIPVEGAGRPLYARATYLANPEDIKVSLSAGNINVSLDELELNTDNIEELIETTNNVLTAFKLETDINIEKTNTLLEYLTATQNESVSLLHALTANTDDLEELVTENNTFLNSLTALNQSEFDETQTLLTNEFNETQTLLNSLTALTQSEFNETQTLLNSLTALQDDKQSQIITLLHQLTANTDELEINTDGVETLLDSLTALQESKQNDIITLLHQLTANTDSLEVNTDEVEFLLSGTNVLLNALTAVDYATSANQVETNSLLSGLTAIQVDKQDQVITLLNQLTANTDSLEVNTDDVEVLLSGTNVLLNSLTAVDYSTATKQDSIITLLDALTAKETTISLDVSAINLNTDEIEGLIQTSNTLLDALTAKQTVTDITGLETRLDVLTAVDYATSFKQDTSNSLLDSLTAIQVDKQDQIITLLHSITSSAIEVDLNTDQLEIHVDDVETLLHDLTASNKYVPGFSIPPYDEILFSYVGSTDIFRTVTYLNNTTQVMSLSFTYITEPPTVGDAIIQSVKKI